MLLPDNIHPEHCLYFNGALVLEELTVKKSDSLVDLYSNIQAKISMSFPLFSMCLDWLFLLGVIDITDNGTVQLCS